MLLACEFARLGNVPQGNYQSCCADGSLRGSICLAHRLDRVVGSSKGNTGKNLSTLRLSYGRAIGE
jgi:hypothetical protein